MNRRRMGQWPRRPVRLPAARLVCAWLRLRLLRAAVIVAWLGIAGAGRLGQQLPKARLLTRLSLRCRQGTTVEVEVYGDDLQEVTRLYFSHPGITAERLPDASGKPLRFKVNVGADVPLGYYDVRLVTKFGVTNPRTFVVGDLPEVVEQEPNNVQSQAMRIELGTVVNGRSLPSEDVDLFVFSAKAGQRVLIECRGKRIDSVWTASCGCTTPRAAIGQQPGRNQPQRKDRSADRLHDSGRRRLLRQDCRLRLQRRRATASIA